MTGLWHLLPCLVLAAGLAAGERPPEPAVPAGGSDLLRADGAWTHWSKDPARGAARVLSRPGGRQRLELVAHAAADRWWEINSTVPVADLVAAGDTCLLSFAARSLGPQPGQLAVFAQKAEAPWTKSLMEVVPVDSQWRVHHLPFRWQEDYQVGAAAIGLGYGFRAQHLAVEHLRLRRYARTDPAALPSTVERLAWGGMAATAAWRRSAAERIDRLRCSDLVVQVFDDTGAPVPGARLELHQVRHAFPFGTAVSAHLLTLETAIGDRYREVLRRNFGAVAFENDLKPRPWRLGAATTRDSSFNRGDLGQALTWCREHGLSVHGHTLAWGTTGGGALSQALAPGSTVAARRQLLTAVDERLDLAAGQIVDWDVLSHPVTGPGPGRGPRRLDAVLGADLFPALFARVAQRAPAVRRWLNEELVIAAGDNADAYEAFLRELLTTTGVGFEGIGLSGHFRPQDLRSVPEMLATLDRFAAFGKPLRISAHGLDTTDERGQADFLADCLTAAFSHPAVVGFFVWGFWEGARWPPDAALWRRNWQAKPAGETWRRLVRRIWWTRATAIADAQGRATIRGFHGDHRLSVGDGVRAVTVEVRLGPGGRRLVVRLPP